MLTIIQRRAVFALFFTLTIVLAAAETFVIIELVSKGLSWQSVLGGLLNTGLLAGCSTIFLKIVEANFLKRDPLPIDALHHYASDRSAILMAAGNTAQSQYELRKALATNTLRLAEQTLKGWVPGSHFELCVFIDAQAPLLFAYYDSHHHSVARSMAARETNPFYYVEKGYEVTKVLNEPTSQPHTINDTLSDKEYSFATEAQRQQIRSTLLLSLDLQAPIALVVSSNVVDAFGNANSATLMPFLRFVGELIRCDLVAEGFAAEIRSLKPNLFALPTTAVPAEQ